MISEHTKIAALKKLPLFQGKAVKVTPFEAGFSASVFYVEVTQSNQAVSRTVAKYIADIDTSNNQLKNTEAFVQQLAANEGLAPNILFTNEQWIISQYIEGEMLSDVDAPIFSKITMLAELTGRLQRISLPKGSPVAKLDVKAATLALTTEARHLVDLTEVENYLDTFEVRSKKLVLCHGDMNFNNIICGDNPYLIDFTTACLAPIEYEIGMLLAINLIDSTHSSKIIGVYNEVFKNNELIDVEMVTRYSVLATLINACWYLLQYHECKDANLLNCCLAQFQYLDVVTGIPFSLTNKMR